MSIYPINELTNAALALSNLSREREVAEREYTRVKEAFKEGFLAVNDETTLDHVFSAYTKKNELNERVLSESKALFDKLSESLKFGIKELGTPLVLPDRPPFRPEAARCLTVRIRPVDESNKSLAKAEPEYDYDVQILKLNP